MWSGKPERINRKTLCNSVQSGGLGLIHVESKCRALRLQHVKQLVTTSASWKPFVIYWVGLQLRGIDNTFASNTRPHSVDIPEFYEHVLDDYRFIKTIDPVIDFSILTTKGTYLKIRNYKEVKPYVETQFTNLKWNNVWNNNFHPFLDNNLKDFNYRTSHNILPVKTKMFLYHVTDNDQCPLCKLKESQEHLLSHCIYTAFLFHCIQQYLTILPKALSLTFKDIKIKTYTEQRDFYIITLVQNTIWLIRNEAHFHRKFLSTEEMKSKLLSKLRLRIKVDKERFPITKFNSYWGSAEFRALGD